MYRFSSRSYANLKGVDPRLVAVATLALSMGEIDFGVTEGLRTIERQRQLVASGASRTMKSRHLTGDAIDVAAYVDGAVRWDWPLYEHIADAFKRAAKDLGIAIVWGGDWTSLRDGPHFELAR
jgi:peptidoglycan L-alanyl-D-glutamate endopeptidase CwlK